MNSRASASFNRLLAACGVAVLAPALRLIPGQTAIAAGSACWVSILAAIPFLLLDIWFLSAFMKNREPGEGMTHLLMRSLGPIFGRAAALIFAAWFVFYCGFILRSGADRFISTVYSSAHPWVFCFTMLFMGLLASLGREDALFRTSKVLSPVVYLVLGAALFLAASTMDVKKLLPVTVSDALPILKGSVWVVNALGAIATYACFLEGGTGKHPRRFKRWSLWLIAPIVLLLVLSAATVGNFGGELTANLSYPFFAMVRNVHILRSVERIEAFVVALWVLPDFVLVSMLLTISSKSLMSVFGYVPGEKTRLTDMKNGRYFIPLCALAAGVVSVVIAPDSFALEKFSAFIVPGINMGLIFVFLPLCFAIGKIRKTI